jgi:S1-C subfamily serine protease
MASSMRRGLCLGLIGALATTAGCGSSGEAVPPRAAPTETLAERLDLGIVAVTARVAGDRVESAGVVLDAERGLILTTAHSVWGARSLKVATGIAMLHGRIVARDSCDDLAVLETQPRIPGLVAARPAAQSTLADAGPLVAVLRRPGLPSPGPELETRRVELAAGAAPRLLPGLTRDATAGLEARALPPEASGAPLLDGDGRLAGMVQVVERGGRVIRAALPWATIAARVGELQPGDRAQYVGWRRHYRCATALHRHAAAQHPRYRRGDARLNAPVPATRLPGTEGADR